MSELEDCLLALESVAGDIFGRAEGTMVDIGYFLQNGGSGELLSHGAIGDIENDFIYIIGLAERGLKVVREFRDSAGGRP